jgi:predicted Zn-dependent protease
LESSYSLDEIREIENEYRNIYTTDDNIALYIFFSNAKAQGESQSSVTLGTAYLNTSLVVYEKTLQDISKSQNLDLELLEAATVHHEFGHILALVDLTNDDIHQQHEDLAHLNHCFVEECLMYFSSNTIRSLKRLGSIPVFDPLCIEDLQAKGGK